MSNRPPEAEKLDTHFPGDGDRLFVDPSRKYNSRIIRDPAEHFYRLPRGYMRAGAILVNQALTNAADRSNIIYAALCCYRQAIELYLIGLIDKFGKGSVDSPQHTHELSALWERFIGIANERAKLEWLGISAVQTLVAEMDQADRKSYGFRFAAGRDDIPFTLGERGIDLINLGEVMERVENFFESAFLDFSHRESAL